MPPGRAGIAGRVACRGGPFLTASGGLRLPRSGRGWGVASGLRIGVRDAAWQVPVLQIPFTRNCHSEWGPVHCRRGRNDTLTGPRGIWPRPR
jgi:hypothetical protein